MPEIYLIRHGETDFNRKGIVQGSGVDAPLNDTGHQQARAFHLFYRAMDFDAVYHSKLKRSRQTLQPWSEKGHIFQEDLALNELNWGDLEGKVPTVEEKQGFLDTLKAWSGGDANARLSNGESAHEAWQRCEAFFATLPEKHSGQKLLICSHGRQMRVILSKLLYGDLQHMELFSPQNTALFILRLDERLKGKASLLNDLRHLKKPVTPSS